jgi:hypothetical protein
MYCGVPVGGNTGLMSLAAQHPHARVDSDTADYLAARRRLFPNLAG